MKRTSILITGVCGNSYGAQIAKSLSLLADKYVLYGADANVQNPHNEMHFRNVFKLPRATEPDYLPALAAVCKQNNIDFFIDGSEAEQFVINKHRQFLTDNGIVWIVNKSEIIDTCIDKIKFIQFMQQEQLYHPRNFYALEELATDAVFPVVLKPKMHSSGSANVYIAQNFDDVKAVIQLSRVPFKDFCIQEYVGTPDSEYTVGVLHDHSGNCLGSATLKRDLQGLSVKIATTNLTNRKNLGNKLVISSGISQGVMMHHPEIEAYCCMIAEKLGSTCALNFQGRLVNNKFYIFEINPRFSGTSFMRALSGFNEADLWIDRLQTNIMSGPVLIATEAKYKRILKEVAE